MRPTTENNTWLAIALGVFLLNTAFTIFLFKTASRTLIYAGVELKLHGFSVVKDNKDGKDYFMPIYERAN